MIYENLQKEIKFKPIQNSENKKIKFCQMFYLRTCVDCETETYGKCTECGNISLCVICKIKHKHEESISQVVVNHRESIPDSDQKKVVAVQ